MPFNRWIGLGLALAVGLILSWVFRWAFGVLRGLTRKRLGEWNDPVFRALEGPAGLVGACAFWYVAVNVLGFEGKHRGLLDKGIEVLILVAFVWAAYGMVEVLAEATRRVARRTDTALDDHLIRFGSRVLKIGVAAVGALMVAQQLGFQVAHIFAGLGLGGLAVALAAKDTLANLFGTLTIIADKTFKVGDPIKFRDIEGTVEEIGFRSTLVRTAADSLVSIPNSVLTNEAVDNLGRRSVRRVRCVLSVRVGTPGPVLEKFVTGLEDLVARWPTTRKETNEIGLVAVSSAALEVQFTCYVKVRTFKEELRERQGLYLEALKLAESLGIALLPPAQHVLVESRLERPGKTV